MLKAYYRLTKPGIIYGNLLTAAAGYFLASKFHIELRLFIATIGGMALVIAAACVFNNYIDRGIDEKMARTKKRALVAGTISPRSALVFGAVLGIFGFLTLVLYTNVLVVWIGAVAFIDYVVLYGISKRRSVHGTLVGSISGSAPVVAGYIAATGHFDFGAVLLFLILCFWQMPHFYAIAIYRMQDYKAAGLPVLPIKKGVLGTKIQIMWYVSGFIIANVLLTLYGYAGYIYLAIMTIVGGVWLWRGARGFQASDNVAWAKRMFLFSLVVILVLSIMLACGSLLP